MIFRARPGGPAAPQPTLLSGTPGRPDPAVPGTRPDRTSASMFPQVRGLHSNPLGAASAGRILPGALVISINSNTLRGEPYGLAGAGQPGAIRAPRYRATLVDPYRDHLRARGAEDPAVPVWRLLAEIREQGYAGSMNLLYRYITQGRAEADGPHLSPRRVTRLLLTRPAALSDSQQSLLAGLTAACPEMTSFAVLVRSFAALLSPEPGKRDQAQGPGRDRPRRGPAEPARLHPRPGPGQTGRHRRRHPTVS